MMQTLLLNVEDVASSDICSVSVRTINKSKFVVFVVWTRICHIIVTSKCVLSAIE